MRKHILIFIFFMLNSCSKNVENKTYNLSRARIETTHLLEFGCGGNHLYMVKFIDTSNYSNNKFYLCSNTTPDTFKIYSLYGIEYNIKYKITGEEQCSDDFGNTSKVEVIEILSSSRI